MNQQDVKKPIKMYPYCVVKLLELPSVYVSYEYVTVPFEWIVACNADDTVMRLQVAYPAEADQLTQKRASRKDPIGNEWKKVLAILMYGADTFEESQNYIVYINPKPLHTKSCDSNRQHSNESSVPYKSTTRDMNTNKTDYILGEKIKPPSSQPLNYSLNRYAESETSLKKTKEALNKTDKETGVSTKAIVMEEKDKLDKASSSNNSMSTIHKQLTRQEKKLLCINSLANAVKDSCVTFKLSGKIMGEIDEILADMKNNFLMFKENVECALKSMEFEEEYDDDDYEGDDISQSESDEVD